MSLDILITTNRITNDPAGRDFVDYSRREAARLDLNDAVIYYDFPTYADYETVAHKPDALVVSPKMGIVAIRFFNANMLPLSEGHFNEIDESLGQFCSILIGRLLKSKSLRNGLSSLRFSVSPVIFLQGDVQNVSEADYSQVVSSYEGYSDLLESLNGPALEPEAFAEMRSVIEGAKALTRPQKRTIANPKVQKYAAALAALELDIANFDQKQRRAALISVPGPQRIRGLAGSGKTVILAMKAAHLHLTRPEDKILVTFYTRSLRAAIRNMITRFYRHYKDEDPNWDCIQVRHGWGGAGNNGVYADACRREGYTPLTFTDAKRMSPAGDPFGFVCKDLSAKGVSPYYDHILVDEGQDFPEGFYELCFNLAKGHRDEKNIVWAYDELQNILNVKLRTPDELFGTDVDGQARISLERAAARLSIAAENDTVLSKCYRNQREVLVTAHAVGFGIYDTIVQLLESREHWEDVGYTVISGDSFKIGQHIKIERPKENNPVSLATDSSMELIGFYLASDMNDEIGWATGQVQKFLEGGLQPEDIMIISLDDRHAKTYFKGISEALADAKINSNNMIADPYSEPPFTITGKVTLSTVYRAKGNEAAVVIAVGTDSVRTKTRSGRNMLFTAFTRSKGWLRISGVSGAEGVQKEVGEALNRFPFLEFNMPDLAQVNLIQRDLSAKSIKAKKIRADFIKKMKSEGYTDEEIDEILPSENRL